MSPSSVAETTVHAPASIWCARRSSVAVGLTSRFASFEGFQKYWVEKIKQLRQGQTTSSAPLTFLVDDFKSEKSVGKTATDAEWKVKVFVRGQRERGPIWSLPVEANFTKGPDGMWYLDDGTLAERPTS